MCHTSFHTSPFQLQMGFNDVLAHNEGGSQQQCRENACNHLVTFNKMDKEISETGRVFELWGKWSRAPHKANLRHLREALKYWRCMQGN